MVNYYLSKPYSQSKPLVKDEIRYHIVNNPLIKSYNLNFLRSPSYTAPCCNFKKNGCYYFVFTNNLKVFLYNFLNFWRYFFPIKPSYRLFPIKSSYVLATLPQGFERKR